MKAFHTLILAGIVSIPALLPAAPVSWSVSSVTGPADVSKAGRLIGAMNVGSTTAQVISGVNFEADVSPSSADTFTFGTGVVQFGFAGGGHFNAWAGGDPGGDAAYGSGLDSARWNDTITGSSILLRSLTPGRDYLVQLWIVDTRPGASSRVRTVDGINTTAGGPNIATGTFTADADTQTISISGVSGSHGPQLNLLQFRDLSPVVVTSAADSGPGSLRQALADTAASSGPNTILFSPALSGQTINIGSSLAINHSGELILDATAVPAGLTISDGGAPQSRNLLTIGSTSTVTIRGIAFHDGGTDWLAEQVHGGAIRNEGTLTATACSFKGNKGADGGAVYNSGTLTLSRCTFFSNRASDGGAVFNRGTLTASFCSFLSNAATDSGAGGAIANALQSDSQASIELTNCTLTDNTAYAGAALHMPSGRLSHCTIAFNSARDGGGGGGIFLSSQSRLTIHNTIVAGNTAPPQPGFSVPTGPDILSLIGSILTCSGKNIVQYGVTPYLGGGGTVEGSGAVLQVDPKISPAGDHGGPTKTCRLHPGSPAIDAAAPVAGLVTDQRGFHRSRNGDAVAAAAPDIGAYESQAPPASAAQSSIVITTASDEFDPPHMAGSGVSLREALAYPLSPVIITFDPDIFDGGPGDVITLDPGKGEFVPRGSTPLRISAAGAKVTISGTGGTGRIFHVPSGTTVTLEALQLTGGKGAGLTRSGYGGAVLNEGTLNISRCTLHGNSAQSGGAIHSSGTLDLTNSTLTGNTAPGGGAVSHEGSLAVTHCTISGNSASGSGAGILVLAPAATTSVRYSIIAGNNSPLNGADVSNIGVLTRQGTNLIQAHLSFFGGTDSGPAALVAAPLLAPPGNYGGPVMTMPPLPGSPSIDAAPGSTTSVDQRGISRQPGDDDAPAVVIPDLGSVEFQQVFVTTLADENDAPAGAGISLREALRDHASGAVPADLISLMPSLSGGVITLNNPGGGASAITVNASVIVDGSGLPNGVKLSGGGVAGYRLLEVSGGVRLTLRGVTLADAGTNSFTEGGALKLQSGSTVTLERCTVSGNRAYLGGAVANYGSLTVSQCTIAGNAAVEHGAAILNQGALEVLHSTISANTLWFPGGAVRNTGSLVLHQSIVADNVPLSDPEILNEGSLLRQGANIIRSLSNAGSGSDSGPAAITAAPLLAPLGNYGGPTAVMTLLPGSPARDAAAGSSIASDQRGFSVVGIPDIGSCEAGHAGNCAAWLWETLPADATEAQHAKDFDFDGDGQSNEAEWVTLTNPGDPSSWFSLTHSLSGTDLNISFPTATGRTYTLWSSVNLAANSWSPHGQTAPVTGDGTQKTFVVPMGTLSREFFRVRAAP